MKKLEEDLSFRVLAAGEFAEATDDLRVSPSPSGGLFGRCSWRVVGLAREMRLASFVKLSINGTKVRANGSKHKAMTYERTGLAEDPDSV